MQRFKDRVIVVTGGSAGIGRASALRFATEGASVLILDVDEAGGQGTVEAITSAGGKAVFRSTDVTDERSVADAMTLCDQEFGPLDVLFNCVGGSSRDDTVVHELDLSLFERTIALDLKSVVICSAAALPRFSDRGGAIVNMSSFTAFRASMRIHAYIAAKGGVSALTRGMAGAYASRGIRVNAVAPGIALSERALQRMETSNPFEGMTFQPADYLFCTGDPADIASVVVFLASDDARMITGQTILADGGITAY